MSHLDPERRDFLIESLSAWLRETIGDATNDVDFELLTGVVAEYGEDLMKPDLAKNGTATLTVRINGGARHTRDLAVLD